MTKKTFGSELLRTKRPIKAFKSLPKRSSKKLFSEGTLGHKIKKTIKGAGETVKMTKSTIKNNIKNRSLENKLIRKQAQNQFIKQTGRSYRPSEFGVSDNRLYNKLLKEIKKSIKNR